VWRSRSRRRHVRAQWDAAQILAAVLGLPGADAFRQKRAAPAVDEGRLGRLSATIVRPTVDPPWPAFVFANGATPDGRSHPVVRRLGVALARAGYAVYIPDLPGVAEGELSPATLTAATRCAIEVADAEDTRCGRVGLVGVSIGGTLALLVAADPRMAARVSVVSCIAPYSDLAKVMMLATTGMYRGLDGLQPYPVPASLAVGLARSLAGMLPASEDARALGRELRALTPDTSDPLSPLRTPAREPLGPECAAVRALLANRDPARFDELYSALPQSVRQTAEALSPVSCAPTLLAPVEIATSPQDKYFPVGESLALACLPRARVTVTSALAHARPRLDPRNVADLLRLDRFVVQTLLAAAVAPPL
jgi:dienelactone hydrolase